MLGFYMTEEDQTRCGLHFFNLLFAYNFIYFSLVCRFQ